MSKQSDDKAARHYKDKPPPDWEAIMILIVCLLAAIAFVAVGISPM